MIDSVRAARSVPGVGDGRSFAVWGHSQGGQAALFTGLLASTYALAAAAPATELRSLIMKDTDTSGGRNITAVTLWSWSRIYDASMATVVTPQAIPVINQLADECIERFFDVLVRRGPTQALARSFLTVNDFADREPWRSLLDRNTPGLLLYISPSFSRKARRTTSFCLRSQSTIAIDFAGPAARSL